MLRRRTDYISINVKTITASDLLPVQLSPRLPPLVTKSNDCLTIPYRFRLKSAIGRNSVNISSEKRISKRVSLVLPPIRLDDRSSTISIRTERSVIQRPPLRALLNDVPAPTRPTERIGERSEKAAERTALYVKSVCQNIEDIGRSRSLIDDNSYEKFARRKPYRRT